MSTVPYTFALGWDPGRAVAARAELLASRRYCTVSPEAEIKPAVSLSQYVLRPLSQGQAGTCWTHAAVCLAETLANSRGYLAFPICRMLAAWEGKQLEGGGNPTNGGAPTDALKGMTSESGVGIAHEDLYPYSDRAADLGRKPPSQIFEDAKKSHLVAVVDVQSNDDMKRLISAGIPTANGTWWPFGFDDHKTFMTSIGSGTYGHALTQIGYVQAGVWPGEHGRYAWQQWRNWHGPLYPPLPPEFAALVSGYKSDSADTTSDMWVREDLVESLQHRGNYEFVSATDLIGIEQRIVVPQFESLLFL